jgi:hypothetical protein
MATATEIVDEIDTRAGALISKSATALSKSEAYARIFKADPPLYARYRAAVQTDVGNQVVLTKQDGTMAPTFGAALMARQLDGLYDLTSALVSTLAGIVSGDVSDKGPLVGQALDDFTAAVRGAFAQADIAVPVAKQLIPPALEAELLRTLLKLAPSDPLGKGATLLTKGFTQLRQELAA